MSAVCRYEWSLHICFNCNSSTRRPPECSSVRSLEQSRYHHYVWCIVALPRCYTRCWSRVTSEQTDTLPSLDTRWGCEDNLCSGIMFILFLICTNELSWPNRANLIIISIIYVLISSFQTFMLNSLLFGLYYCLPDSLMSHRIVRELRLDLLSLHKHDSYRTVRWFKSDTPIDHSHARFGELSNSKDLGPYLSA